MTAERGGCDTSRKALVAWRGCLLPVTIQECGTWQTVVLCEAGYRLSFGERLFSQLKKLLSFSTAVFHYRVRGK